MSTYIEFTGFRNERDFMEVHFPNEAPSKQEESSIFSDAKFKAIKYCWRVSWKNFYDINKKYRNFFKRDLTWRQIRE